MGIQKVEEPAIPTVDGPYSHCYPSYRQATLGLFSRRGSIFMPEPVLNTDFESDECPQCHGRATIGSSVFGTERGCFSCKGAKRVNFRPKQDDAGNDVTPR